MRWPVTTRHDERRRHVGRAPGPRRSVPGVSSYGGQVAFPGNSLYHATKWGIEGFVEAVAPEVAAFGIGMTIVEPGGARTEFRYGSARVADLLPVHDDTPAHSFLRMLDPANGLAPRRPRAHGRTHHRQRRHRTRTAAHGARLTGSDLREEGLTSTSALRCRCRAGISWPSGVRPPQLLACRSAVRTTLIRWRVAAIAARRSCRRAATSSAACAGCASACRRRPLSPSG
jgi:hypothetical protein